MDSNKCYFEEDLKNELIFCPNWRKEKKKLFELNNMELKILKI